MQRSITRHTLSSRKFKLTTPSVGVKYFRRLSLKEALESGLMLVPTSTSLLMQ